MRSEWSANGPVIRTDETLGTEVTRFFANQLGQGRGRVQTEVGWTTENEQATGFIVERSTSPDGPWVQVGPEVDAQGQEVNDYLILDSFQRKGARTVYYRLDVLDPGAVDNFAGPIPLVLSSPSGKPRPNKQD
jgi:hypothetical protein